MIPDANNIAAFELFKIPAFELARYKTIASSKIQYPPDAQEKYCPYHDSAIDGAKHAQRRIEGSQGRNLCENKNNKSN
jgi:hypothetical protein